MYYYFKTKTAIQKTFSFLYRKGYHWNRSSLRTLVAINLDSLPDKDFYFAVDTEENAFGAAFDLESATAAIGSPSEIENVGTLEGLINAIEQPVCKSAIRINTMQDAIIPGCFVEYKDSLDNLCSGFITSNKNLAIYDVNLQEWKVISNFTEKDPLVITRIFSADSDGNTITIWRQEPKVKRTIADIEKALGMNPGSLEII